MTSKLAGRLARLEGRSRDPETAIPTVVAVAWLHAMAITLGGFPLSGHNPLEAKATLDTVADGLARALGYADGRTMAEDAEVQPEAWSMRLDLAHDALVERYGGDMGAGFRLARAALDAIAAAKARGFAYEPTLEVARPEHCLHRALLHLGVMPEVLAIAAVA